MANHIAEEKKLVAALLRIQNDQFASYFIEFLKERSNEHKDDLASCVSTDSFRILQGRARECDEIVKMFEDARFRLKKMEDVGFIEDSGMMAAL